MDVNTRDNFKQTPLFYAARNGNERVVKLLLDRGADVDARTRNLYNRRPRFDFTIADHIMGSIEDSYYADVRTPLHYARNKQIKKTLTRQWCKFNTSLYASSKKSWDYFRMCDCFYYDCVS